MMVPRSFVGASPPLREFKEKNVRQNGPRHTPRGPEKNLELRRPSPSRTSTEPAQVPSRAIPVPTPERSHPIEQPARPAMRREPGSSARKPSPAHNPNAMPPAVAALLAVSQIPRPKPHQFRTRPSVPRQISIDELVQEWKNDDSLNPRYSSSPALSILLEDTDDRDVQDSRPGENVAEEDWLYTRKTSAESVPSLEDDEKSIMSNSSLPTPESLRSRKSTSNLRKEKARSLPTAEECASNHPLVPAPPLDEDPDDGLIISPSGNSRATTPKPKSSFKSNLTTSLQLLKNAAINSISSFGLSSALSPSQRSPSSPLSDDMLWSHPFLFPRFSPEVRPAIEGTPSEAQRRYLNPVPVSFEELEAPFQLALHAPYLAEPIEGAPAIAMQTYSRTRRKSINKRSGLDPQSEAGRALLGAAGVRQREPRENSDFLRVVVLEMNMRREGKLETGRAKIWLPPRQVSASVDRSGPVPRRWVGESAY